MTESQARRMSGAKVNQRAATQGYHILKLNFFPCEACRKLRRTCRRLGTCVKRGRGALPDSPNDPFLTSQLAGECSLFSHLMIWQPTASNMTAREASCRRNILAAFPLLALLTTYGATADSSLLNDPCYSYCNGVVRFRSAISIAVILLNMT